MMMTMMMMMCARRGYKMPLLLHRTYSYIQIRHREMGKVRVVEGERVRIVRIDWVSI